MSPIRLKLTHPSHCLMQISFHGQMEVPAGGSPHGKMTAAQTSADIYAENL